MSLNEALPTHKFLYNRQNLTKTVKCKGFISGNTNKKHQVKAVIDRSNVFHSSDAIFLQSNRSLKEAMEKLKLIQAKDAKVNKQIKKCSQDFTNQQNYLKQLVTSIEDRLEYNLLSRQNYEINILNKLEEFLKVSIQIKLEIAKELLLVQIGLCLKDVFQQLEPYESILSRLASELKHCTTKSEIVLIRKNIIEARRDNLRQKLNEIVQTSENIRKNLFEIIYSNRNEHLNKINTISTLQRNNTMRLILDREHSLISMENIVVSKESESAYFYWFLDWALFDIIGYNMLPNSITRNSSSSEKVEALISGYQRLKQQAPVTLIGQTKI